MGIKERQGREREAIRRAILDAARDLFVRDGYQNVSIRKIAERIEYSPAAIYSYFPSKDDIFFALAEEGFRLLFSYGLEAPGDAAREPLGRLRAMFLRYYEFSKEHPEYFALMFLDRSVPRISQNWNRFGFVGEMRHEMIGRIRRAIEAGALPAGTSAECVLRVALTSVHGAATMRLCDRLGRGEDGDALARITLDSALMGLRAGAGAGINDETFPPCSFTDSEDKQS